ncbi:MAG: AraC family transcriptional regulator [Firmicutes bacterium]|nr:AraC family transcriptional regulator [Bacillota bacterium]
MAHTHYYIENPKGQVLSLNPELLYTGLVADDPNWFNVRHLHDTCELLYVAGGEGQITIGETTYPIRTGHLIIINPYVFHEERTAKENPLQLIFLSMKNFSLPGLKINQLIDDKTCPVIDCGKYKHQIDTYFRMLLTESSSQIQYYQQITKSLLIAIIVMTLRMLSIGGNGQEEMSVNCQKVRDYLDKNYTEAITLESLSEMVYVSKCYLSHMFKEQTGVSPIKYLTQKRIESACGLLRDTDMSVKEISRTVGYENPLYFSQVFKNVINVSPLDYRNNHRKLNANSGSMNNP